MIPRIVHQTARTHEVPAQWMQTQASVRETYPNYEYRLWSDSDNAEFVNQYFPDMEAFFWALPRNIMRVDVVRYMYVYAFGGVYMDMDYEALRPFDWTQHSCVLPLEVDGDIAQGKGRIANAVFGAERGHPFFGRVLSKLQERSEVSADADVLSTTGPHFLTAVLRDFLSAPGGEEGITLPPSILFNPPTPKNRRAQARIIRSGQSYGIHHCSGSWREFSRRDRLKQAVARLCP